MPLCGTKMMSCKKILFLVCIGVLLVNGQDENNVVDEDLTITKSQKDALDKVGVKKKE